MSRQPNFNFNHFAISVPNAEAAVEWYQKVFGFKILAPLMVAKASGPSVYGKDLKEMKLAVLSTGNGIALEIFEFVDPPCNGPKERVDWSTDTYTRGGFFHFCITTPDVEKVGELACSLGGKQVGQTTESFTGEKAIYLQDPWGNVVELLSDGFEHFIATMMAAK